MVAAAAAAASATSSSVSAGQPLGFGARDHRLEEEEELLLAFGQAGHRRHQRGDVHFLLLSTTAAGCSRDAARWGQSDGQSISTSRFVAQQTVQMVRLSAGQLRFSFRVAKGTGHDASFTHPALGNRREIPDEVPLV